MNAGAKSAPISIRRIVATALPAAAAIAVFGTFYGAGAGKILGASLTIASSLFIFSGALQFALVALVAAGASPLPLLLAAATLNLRHLVLGAVLRPRIGGSRMRRTGSAFFLVDETFGFALAAGNAAERDGQDTQAAAERTLLVAGALCYLAWQLGTIIGVLGATLAPVEGLAGAIFPVLFIGLAALTATRWSHTLRAVAAALLTAGLALAVPDLRTFAPLIAGVLAALPPGDR